MNGLGSSTPDQCSESALAAAISTHHGAHNLFQLGGPSDDRGGICSPRCPMPGSTSETLSSLKCRSAEVEVT
jgi:hypothetical protein